MLGAIARCLRAVPQVRGGYPGRVTGTEGPPATFRLAYVPGVTPGKWVRTWQERMPDMPLDLIALDGADAPAALRAGTADAGLLRLPLDPTGLSVIRLYTETTVAVVPKDHEAAAVEELSIADLDDYVVLRPLDDCLPWESGQLPGTPAKERPATTADAVALVAAGVGLLIAPQSLARLHHRRDLTYRPLVDAAQSEIGLCWPQERTTDQVEDFIGIVRGRTANSSRGRQAQQAEQPKKKREPARSKQADSAQRRTAKSAQPKRPARQNRTRRGRG